MRILFLLTALSCYGSIIKKPPVVIRPTEIAYKDLPCPEADQKIIEHIITKIDSDSWFDLWYTRTEVYKLGALIDELHPLKFLTSILTNPKAKLSLQRFWPDVLKRGGFLDGLVPKMNRESEKGLLNQYIEGFAEELQVHPEEIRPYFDKKEWESLVEYLIR